MYFLLFSAVILTVLLRNIHLNLKVLDYHLRVVSLHSNLSSVLAFHRLVHFYGFLIFN